MARVVSALLLLLASSQAIDVRLPPSIITGPEITRHGPKKHQMFKIDDTIALPCVATGTPDPEYEWYRDGSLMDLNNHVNINLDPSQPGTGSIVIRPAYSLDEGYYQCRVENEHGIAMSQIVYLQRARLEPVGSGSAKDYPVTEGEALKLPCSTGISIPIPKYSWSTAETIDATGSTSIVLNKRINIDEEGNLYFSYVVAEDAKYGFVYKCNVFNDILDIQSGGSYAKVQVINYPAATDLLPENIYHTPDDVIAIKGKEQRLKCLFKGKPEVSISWGRDTSVGLPPYHKVQSSTTELVIDPVALDDEAVYTCTGNNYMGSTKQNIYVRVEAEPEFEIATDRPRDMNFTEGDVAEFRCWAFAIPDAKVQWFINAERFEDVKPGNRYQISDDGKTLIIEDVCKDCDDGSSDIMNIQCNASNVHGYTYGGGYLNVLRATTIASEDGPVSTSIKYGEENITSLDCFATSDDSTPISYRWQHDGKDVDYYLDGKIWMAENNSLIFKVEDKETAKKYAGEYTCVATNGYSTAVASAVVHLEGYNPKGKSPEFLSFTIAAILVLVIAVFVIVGCCVKRRIIRENVLRRIRRKKKKDGRIQSKSRQSDVYDSIPDSWFEGENGHQSHQFLPLDTQHEARHLDKDKECEVKQPTGDIEYDEVTQPTGDIEYEVTSPAGDAEYEVPRPTSETCYEALQSADKPRSATPDECSTDPGYIIPGYPVEDHGYITPGYEVDSD